MSPLGTGAPARGADEWVERVRASSDIVEVVAQSVTLKRVGRNWVGLCPFHQEKTASFSVNAERQFYHCFSCKAGGDVFKYVQETEKVGFVEAVELLSRRAGIPVPERRSGERSARTPLLDALEAAATAYEQWLADPGRGAPVRAYLESRGIGPETVREFRLGFAPPGWENLGPRLHERFPEEILIQAGLLARRETGRGSYDRFRERLMVPLLAPGGRVLGFGARALKEGDEPKYLNSPETPVYQKSTFLFAYEQARRHLNPEGEAIVVEGYFDAMALHQAGLRNTVATSGTALTTEHARQLKRAVSRVALTFDGDAAGQEAMMRSLSQLLAEGLDVAVVTLPKGEDPDSLVRGGGVAAWDQARGNASDPVEFIQRRGLGSARGEAAKERALHAVVRLAAGVRDPIRRSLLLERAGQVFGFAESVLTRAVTLHQAGQRSEAPIAVAVREQSRSETHIEREVLQALLMDPGARDEARRTLSPEDFHDPTAAALARWMWSGGEGDPEDAAAAALARELSAGAAERWEWARVAQGGIRRLGRRRLERQYKVAQQKIRELQRSGRGSDPEVFELLKESQELARGISELNP